MNSHFELRETCPGCDSSDHTVLYSCGYTEDPVRRYLLSFYASQGHIDLQYLEGARFILRECTKCGMIFQQEVPDSFLMHTLYEKWIDPVMAFDKIQKDADVNRYLRYLQEIMIVIRYLRKPPGSIDILDFGMGWGHWCLAAKALGCNVYGIELSREQTDHARSQGIRTIGREELPRYRFDFINTEQVFEHLPDPLTTLRCLKGSMKQGGVLKISVPDGADIKRRLKRGRWDSPKGSRNSLNAVSPMEHINCFRRSTLISMAASCGLERITIPLRIQYACSIIWKPFMEMGKNLLLPLYRDVFNKGIYLFFRNNEPS